MTLSTERLQQFLRTPFRYFDVVDSTNDLATVWLKEGAEHGSAVLADEQRKGRGRMGRVWHTPAGVALAVSIILRPDPDDLPAIGMAGAVSVAELCLAVGLADVGIKWPNDVRVGGKKVCGILPEAVWVGDQLEGVILGIGVNVRVPFTGELAQTAISLETVAGRTLDRSELAAELIARVVYWMQASASENLYQRWRELLDTPGNVVRIGNLEGLAVDVDRSGALLLQCSDGQIERVIAGDVMLIER